MPILKLILTFFLHRGNGISTEAVGARGKNAIIHNNV